MVLVPSILWKVIILLLKFIRVKSVFNIMMFNKVFLEELLFKSLRYQRKCRKKHCPGHCIPVDVYCCLSEYIGFCSMSIFHSQYDIVSFRPIYISRAVIWHWLLKWCSKKKNLLIWKYFVNWKEKKLLVFYINPLLWMSIHGELFQHLI